MERLLRSPLSLVWGASLFLYLLFPFWFPLLTTYNRLPLADIYTFTPSVGAALLYGALLSLLFALFYLSYRKVRLAEHPPALPLITGVSALFSLPLLFTYPINANDIYRYFIRGRIMSVYQGNPYLSPPSAFPTEPFLQYAGEWVSETSPYGPVWELLASGVAALSGDSLLRGIILFKLLNIVLFLGSAVLIWLIFSTPRFVSGKMVSPRPADRSASTLLWAWNPALLLIFIVSGHNDALMIFLLLLGAYLLRLQRPVLGLLIMMVGALVKPVGVLALPFFLLSILKSKETILSQIRFLLVITAGGVGLLFLTFWRFGSPLDLVQRLMREAGEGAGFSPAALFFLLSEPGNLGFLLPLSTRLGSILLIIFICLLSWLTWRGRSAMKAAADVYFGYILQALNYRIWYASWPFPWLVLDSGDNPFDRFSAIRLHSGLWFLYLSQLSVLIYRHLRIFALGGSHKQAHLIGVPLIFLGSLIFALLGNRASLRD